MVPDVMAVGQVFSVNGLDEFLSTNEARFGNAGMKLSAEMANLADRWGPILTATLMEEAPVNKNRWDPVAMAHAGRLRDSIRYERASSVDKILMQFTTNIPYAEYVIEGTAPHDIYPVSAQALHWIGP